MKWHVLDCLHLELEDILNKIQNDDGTIVQIIWCQKDGSPQEPGAITRHFMIIYTTKK